MTRRLPLALASLLLLASPAWAAPGDDAGAAFVFGPLLFAVLAYPVGLALHALILAYAPRRGQGLVRTLEDHRGRTILLGVLNTGFLLLVALSLRKAAPPLAALATLLWWALAFVGSHGIARGLGARVLGRPVALDGPADLRQVALGWFVLLFALGVPGLGLLLGLYWAVRATGGVVLAALATFVPAESAGKEPHPDDRPGDPRDLLG